ncbi:MAG: hypothetical protein WBP72_14365, partial [Rhodocyclaceae bacterium]
PPPVSDLRQAIDSGELAARLNRVCQCFSLDRTVLQRELDADESGADLQRLLDHGRPHLFSDSAVFVGAGEIRRMAAIVAAVEEVVANPAFRSHVLAYAPAAAQAASPAAGVFLGYDFHLGTNGPQLIEINTNAGGGLLNAVLARAQQACCGGVMATLPGAVGSASAEQVFLQMFLEEWQRCRGETPLRRVAIVDESPPDQYLYPEFVLFQHLFQRHGFEAEICDPEDLVFRDAGLWLGDRRIDLVYNRLTDFGLEAANAVALREAYRLDAAVVTPNPRHHALYADKRNLVALTDEALLAAFGVAEATRHVLLSGIPPTETVVREDAERFWQQRRRLFFKPAAGFGSRAAYRGDKLTRRVFEEILGGCYVAQGSVEPSRRRIDVDGEPVDLKVDLRNYVYRGQVQLVAARLYQGQTTNFRTPGGGFAPVLTVPCAQCADETHGAEEGR